MDRRVYDRTREGEFIGRKVISLVPLTNGLYRFPAGITWTIKRKKGGFELLSDRCPHCGIQAYISHVPPGDVDFTDMKNLWPAPPAARVQADGIKIPEQWPQVKDEPAHAEVRGWGPARPPSSPVCSPEDPCCDRRGEYNGFGTGPLKFICPKHCGCHD